MDVVPASVGRASRGWDEQHLDVQAAAGQIAQATTSGFTAAVAGPAARFVRAWERHVDALGLGCEGQADGLRTTIRDYVESDEAVGADYLALLPYLTEVR